MDRVKDLVLGLGFMFMVKFRVWGKGLDSGFGVRVLG